MCVCVRACVRACMCLNIQQMGSGSVCHTTLLFILAAGGWVWVWVWIWIRQTGVSFSTAPSCACVCVNLSLCTLSALCTCLLRGSSLPFFLKECFNRSLKPYQRTETLKSYSSRTESNYLRGRFPLLRLPFCIHYAVLVELHVYGLLRKIWILLKLPENLKKVYKTVLAGGWNTDALFKSWVFYKKVRSSCLAVSLDLIDYIDNIQ